MIEVNYLVIGACAMLAMVVGAVWYGALFGKAWCRLEGVDPNDKEAVKAMQSGMGPTYVVQFVMSLLFVYVLFHYLKGAEAEMSLMSNALWIWVGFIVPTLASTVLWTTQSAKDQKIRFGIQAGYNLVILVLFALIIDMWA